VSLRIRPTLVLMSGLLVGSSVVLAIVVYLTHASLPVRAAGEPPADTFMHSVAIRDGRLGWQQLCPGAQGELPIDVLVQQTDALRAADAATGISVRINFVGADPRPEGGERRTYLATAWQLGAPLTQKTFVVRTQPNGCVEALE
jgi:hypothetical protein